MRSTSLLILFLSLLLQLVSTKSQKPLAPAFYVFGDALSDSGNNNKLQTQAKANYRPYGIDFGGRATGRFTNGRTVADFLARLLGLPDLPPYMGMSPSQRRQTLTGVTYASGSAGILRDTGSAFGQNIPLDRQLDLFQWNIYNDLATQFGSPRALIEYLSKSVFMVSIGSNDYLNNYLQPDLYDSSRLYSPQQFAQLLILRLSLGLRRLYILGARKMLVFEISALGCIPAIANTFTANGSCVEQVNQMVTSYNVQLPNLLQQLQSNLRGLTITRGVIFPTGIAAKQNPSQFGFTNGNDPCCAVNGNESQCTPNGATCNRNQYFYFDNANPTEAVNSLVANACFDQGTSICSPFNLKQLAQSSYH